jgi:molybdopterin converting factor small subunit
MKVEVMFFGVLAEVTGILSKHYYDVHSTGDLELRVLDDFPEIAHYDYRISLNDLLIDGDAELSDKDELALIPPFDGG